MNELPITIPTAVPSYSSPFCPILPLPKASVPNGYPLPPLRDDTFDRDFTAFSRIQQVPSEQESDKTEEEDEYEVNYKD
jgi:hypothetical protein